MSAITDVGGILVGHHHRIDPDATLGSGWASGTTVVLTPPGTVGAVDVPGRRAGHPRDRPARPDQLGAPRRRRGAHRRQRLRAGRRRRRDDLARGARPRRRDGGRRGADRARRGDLRPAGRRLAVPADGGVRLRRRRERRAPTWPSAPSARASGARVGVLKGGVGHRVGRRCRLGRHGRGAWWSSTPQATPSTRRPACRGWRIRSRSSGSSVRRPTRSPPTPTGDTELSPLNTTIAVVATDAAAEYGRLPPRRRRRA